VKCFTAHFFCVDYIALVMHTHTPKLSQIIMTGLGLMLFALALMLDHYHPRNQGVAEITHSIYKRFGVDSSASTPSAGFAYVSPVAQIKPKAKTKMPDPTTTAKTASADKTLPTILLANGQADPNSSSDTDTDAAQPSQNNGDQTQPDSSQPPTTHDKSN
jgi:hypothetical protein